MMIDTLSVKSIIKENVGSIHCITDLARLLGVPAETLKKSFVRKEQMPLSRYLTSVRVTQAKTLLLQSNMNCKEICYSVGFQREDVGARTFRRESGQTMKDFRNQNKSMRSSSSVLDRCN
jgi:AraC-like DNA-binding protein